MSFDRLRTEWCDDVSRRFSEQQQNDIFKVAERQFAASGLARTNMTAVAKEAGISEPTLYSHFGTKQQLFQEVIKHNSQVRLAALRRRFFSIADLPPVECIERMAEATVLACVEDGCNASVMVRGLMEIPDFAGDVYRCEIGYTEALWNAGIRMRFEDSLVRSRLAVHLVPYAGHACMAFGFWLATLGHKPTTAKAHACQYAGAAVYVARAVLSLAPESFGAATTLVPASREMAP